MRKAKILKKLMGFKKGTILPIEENKHASENDYILVRISENSSYQLSNGEYEIIQ